MNTLFFLLQVRKYVKQNGCNLEEDVHKMIRKIYSSMVCKDYNGDKISREIKDEIATLLKNRKEKMSNQEYRQYQDELNLIASASEESGFVKGFQFAFWLFAEVIQK